MNKCEWVRGCKKVYVCGSIVCEGVYTLDSVTAMDVMDG